MAPPFRWLKGDEVSLSGRVTTRAAIMAADSIAKIQLYDAKYPGKRMKAEAERERKAKAAAKMQEKREKAAAKKAEIIFSDCATGPPPLPRERRLFFGLPAAATTYLSAPLRIPAHALLYCDETAGAGGPAGIFPAH